MSNDINDVLAERKSRYGSFADHAFLCQALTDSMRRHPNWGDLPPAIREAFEMAQHKFARAINGDWKHEDNIVDAIGYLTRALQFIRGEET